MPDADEPPELYALPTVEDQEYWERFHAAGLHQPDLAAITNGSGSFAWVNLTHPDYADPPDPPTVQGLLYAGRRHVISGPPESTKTLIAYMLLIQALREDNGVCVLDFEMGPHAAATLLRELGATEQELERIQYTEPEQPPTPTDIQRIVGLGTGYCLIDAAAGAYDATGLDDNSRKDAEQFASKWIRPLWQAGIATIVIDHVVKSADQRGSWVIGSERKIGQCDVHLSLESLKPLTRGGDGMVKINVKRDRPGHLPRPTAYVVELASDADHRLSWTLRDPHPSDIADGYFRPTVLMERVSRWLEENGGEWSQAKVEENVKGKGTGIRDALNALRKEGYITRDEVGTSHRFKHFRPYREKDDLVPAGSYYPSQNQDLVPTSSHLVPSPAGDLVPRPPSLEGDEVGRDTQIDVHDPAVQALLDDNIPF